MDYIITLLKDVVKPQPHIKDLDMSFETIKTIEQFKQIEDI